MANHNGLQVPTRPDRTVPDAEQARRDWVDHGTAPAPAGKGPAPRRAAKTKAKEKQVRMSFRVPESLNKQFRIALALSDADPTEVLCELVQRYVEEQNLSAADIRRALAA